jgi:hypothetical protein
MMLSEFEANTCFKLCSHPKTTEDEKQFLGYMAGFGHACEEVSETEYSRAGRLAGWLLSPETPIVDRA